MGNYFFPKDLEESKVAIEVVKTFLDEKHGDASNLLIEDLEKGRQIEGDVEITSDCGLSYCVEVKYDMMAQKTGNLCFETHNVKGKLTGISSTEADEIHYVVPREKGFTLYMFKTDKLKDYLFKSGNNFRSVKGGDRYSTFMLLVPRTTIEKDGIAYRMESIDA